MERINREINKKKMHDSKQVTISFVMNEISTTTRKESSFFLKRLYFASAFTFVFVFILIFSFNKERTISSEPVLTLSDTEGTSIAEAAYISGYLLSESLSLENTLSTFPTNKYVNMMHTLQIENEDIDLEEYKSYFEILITLYNDSDFSDQVEMTKLEDAEYDNKIIFMNNNNEYTMYINRYQENVTGIIQIGPKEMTLEGTMNISDNEINIDIKAINNKDFIEIKYLKLTSNITEKRYELTQNINGELSTKEIKVQYKPDYKVEMTENTDSYELKQVLINNQLVYKLEIKLNENDIELFIIETEDSEGNIIYEYKTEEEYDQKKNNKENKL